ncbi:MAG: MotA/TolQ/ExbB proton channel family protein [Flavobacteriaceae bacterium]|nr:MotA/TolQ/ExbB proton channel family protein [Flavobacteriaceae bacterium]
MFFTLLQESELDKYSESISEEKTLSIYELIIQGGLGGQIIIGILALLLLVNMYIYFERYFALKSVTKMDSNFMNKIRDNIANGNIDAAIRLCQESQYPAANLIHKGITRIGKPLEDINSAIENAGKLEIYKLEKNVSILATISSIGPMIGFLGTVTGMILTIHEIANAGGQIDIKLLSNGLYTAMTTTVAGLIVGIISYITYNHLVVKTDKAVHFMEEKSIEFLDLLNEPA